MTKLQKHNMQLCALDEGPVQLANAMPTKSIDIKLAYPHPVLMT